MNKVIITGNIAKEIEVKYTQTGKCVSNFTVAVNEGYGDKQKTTFINCVAWEKTAEALGNYCSKGSKVLVEGSLQVRSYDAQDGSKRWVTEILVRNVEFIGSKPKEQQQNIHSDIGTPVDDNTEIPF